MKNTNNNNPKTKFVHRFFNNNNPKTQLFIGVSTTKTTTANHKQ